MEKDQLSLFFQPQLDLQSQKVIGAEALLRWWKPDNSKEGGVYIPCPIRSRCRTIGINCAHGGMGHV